MFFSLFPFIPENLLCAGSVVVPEFSDQELFRRCKFKIVDLFSGQCCTENQPPGNVIYGEFRLILNQRQVDSQELMGNIYSCRKFVAVLFIRRTEMEDKPAGIICFGCAEQVNRVGFQILDVIFE